MADIKIINREKLTQLQSASMGQRKIVVDALVAGAKNTDELLKVAVPKIESAGTEQTGKYVVQYYLSELRKYAVIEGGKMSAGRGKIQAILQSK